MKTPLPLLAALALSACATVGSYLNGAYNAAAFPPLDSPRSDVALVRQSSVENAASVLSSVDGEPILVKPSGDGEGLWAKQVALRPGEHTVLTGWRLPGRYSPPALLCSHAFAAGHEYAIDYDVSIPRQARAWITDVESGARVADCRPRPG